MRFFRFVPFIFRKSITAEIPPCHDRFSVFVEVEIDGIGKGFPRIDGVEHADTERQTALSWITGSPQMMNTRVRAIVERTARIFLDIYGGRAPSHRGFDPFA